MPKLETAEEFASLMGRVRLGDDDALAQLVLHYEREVERTAQVMLSRTLRSYLDPADLVQSVHRSLLPFLRQNKGTIDDPQKLRALAVTLARRKIIQHWRRLQCQHRFQAEMVDTESPTAVRTVGVSAEPDPAAVAQCNDLMQQLRSQLDETECRLVELRLQGATTAEAAREMGVDADVLRVRLSRLRRRLRAHVPQLDWL
jgi:RNA polymerase sigma-70 factor (ECF subfamily)